MQDVVGPPSYLVACPQPPGKINTAFGPARLNSGIRQLAFACSLVRNDLSAVAGGAGKEPVAQQ